MAELGTLATQGNAPRLYENRGFSRRGPVTGGRRPLKTKAKNGRQGKKLDLSRSGILAGSRALRGGIGRSGARLRSKRVQ